ncbi:glycoside hydrolase family 30 protein [Parasediminibacterium sp. JCM 36343]|uniref:glycoside hydrolase family 30 protein n=1 Tax=Parasediminibacterium sp. JCM 36343 TaxID=3374279 RepID=UPI00397BCC80
MKKNKLLYSLLFTGSCIAICQSFAQPAGKYNLRNKAVTVYTTASNTNLKLSATGALQFKDAVQPTETEIFVYVDPLHTFQTMLGIGGALTDAAAETLAKLPREKQQEVLKAYYDKKDGIGYTLGRVNMNSCDFSSDMYTYVDEKDSSLSTFNIKHDKQYKLPLIKQAIAAAGGQLTLFASPWSPPAWMKSNNDILHGGKLLQQYKQSWANYYVKFIKAYAKEGVPVWGFTVQNEPMASQRWESCVYTAEEERDFIKQYLGPTIEKAGLSNKKLIAWDHNRDLLPQRASVILNDPAAAKYVWGIGYHWYETWTGNAMQFDNVKRVKESFPNKNLLFTEGCIERFNFDSIYNWKLGEKYGYSMINDFNAGTVGWTDWNILLDETGGPNHVSNFTFSPIMADTRNGQLLYTNCYYYIGHLSKFIHSGAKRVAVTTNRDKLLATSFINPDGKLVVVVMNATNEPMPYHLIISNKMVEANSLAHSISTLVVE